MDNLVTQQEQTLKTCNRCKQEKPLSEFHKRNHTKCGVVSYCKECRSNEQKASIQKKREKRGLNNPKLPIENKLCSVCKTIKPVSEFHKRGDSYKHNCKECRKLESSQRYLENRDHILETNNKWKDSNKEQYNNIIKRWVDNNREKARKYWREYNRRNRGKVNANSKKYQTMKLNAVPQWFEADPIRLLYKKAQEYSFHVDHIVPLNSDYVCGLHCFDNLQLLDQELNLKKSNKYWPDMWDYS